MEKKEEIKERISQLKKVPLTSIAGRFGYRFLKDKGKHAWLVFENEDIGEPLPYRPKYKDWNEDLFEME